MYEDALRDANEARDVLAHPLLAEVFVACMASDDDLMWARLYLAGKYGGIGLGAGAAASSAPDLILPQQ
tara:strand:- start:748 stop:954 length:207 start_codon:yes stop_codon:yes gene_type:complete